MSGGAASAAAQDFTARLDRVPLSVFQTTLLVYSVFTGLSALAFNAATLMVLRFLAGLGLGGELPVASTLIAELAPARRRGALVVVALGEETRGRTLEQIAGA